MRLALLLIILSIFYFTYFYKQKTSKAVRFIHVSMITHWSCRSVYSQTRNNTVPDQHHQYLAESISLHLQCAFVHLWEQKQIHPSSPPPDLPVISLRLISLVIVASASSLYNFLIILMTIPYNSLKCV